MLMAASGQTRGSHEFIFGQKLGSFSFRFFVACNSSECGETEQESERIWKTEKVYVEISCFFLHHYFCFKAFLIPLWNEH